jgi:hypothetical protein
MYYLTHGNGSRSLADNPVSTNGKKDEEFRMKRVLNAPYSKTFHLWALATGAVISGDYTGWNLGKMECLSKIFRFSNRIWGIIVCHYYHYAHVLGLDLFFG